MTKSESILRDIVIQVSTRIKQIEKHKKTFAKSEFELCKMAYIFTEREHIKTLVNIIKLHLVTYSEDIQTIRNFFNKQRG